jgi:N6-L-threonylcarbamoyladenine synthase
MAKMTILAIESSCDETAAAVISDGKIKSSIIASQASMHAQYGGVVPEVAARSHVEAIIPTIELALKEAQTKLTDLDYIAVTQGPGLMTSLMVGVDTAKALGTALDIPVIPINHLEGHIYANFVGKFKISNLKFKILPAIILIVSGGHTLLVEIKNHGVYRILGETVDDAAGEAFDKTAKMLKLGYPGGPMISKLAKQGNPQAFAFPRPMINSGNFEFSFSGLKTAVLYKTQELKTISSKQKSDLAASLQQAIVDVLIAKLEKTIQRYKPKTILLGGGVAANSLLRERFKQLATTYHLASNIPAFEYCTDNAAMIGLAAYYRLKNNKAHFGKNFSADPNLKLK